MTTPTTDTQTRFCEEITPSRDRKTTTPCLHCGSTVKHSDRIGCCSLCKVLFSSLSAFDKHLRHGHHLTPEEAGLEARVDNRDTSIPVWGHPAPASKIWK